MDGPGVPAQFRAHLQAAQQGCLSLGSTTRQGPAHITGDMPQVWASLQAAQQVCDMSCLEWPT